VLPTIFGTVPLPHLQAGNVERSVIQHFLVRYHHRAVLFFFIALIWMISQGDPDDNTKAASAPVNSVWNRGGPIRYLELKPYHKLTAEALRTALDDGFFAAGNGCYDDEERVAAHCIKVTRPVPLPMTIVSL
jgi:hypothetical protein